MKFKQTVQETVQTTKNVWSNAKEFTLATSLVIVSVYNAYDLLNRTVGDVEYAVRAAASALIAVEGALAVIKFFNKK